jgi:hypothetical protein
MHPHSSRPPALHRMAGTGRLTLWLLIAVAARIGSPASALAADTYVGGANADDGNTCTSPSTPCASIAGGLNQADSGDTVHVAPGGYGVGLPGLSIGDGKSLVAESSDPSQTTITGGGTSCQVSSSFVLITVAGDAGRIAGFTLRNYPCFGPEVIRADHAVTLEHDVFDDDQAPNDVYVGGGSPLIRDDSFRDPDPTNDVLLGGAPQIGVRLDSGPGTSPELSGSSFSGFPLSVEAVPQSASGGSTPLIDGNSITPTDHFSHTASVPHGLAIEVSDEDPTITANSVTAGARYTADGFQEGIRLHEGGDAVQTGATLERNLIDGKEDLAPGLSVEGTQGPVSLFGDELISTHISMNADVSATNITVAPDVVAIDDSGAHLTLDSSLLYTPPGSPANSIAFSGGATCDISYSRGNLSVADPSGCGSFQTTAAPAFVSAGPPFDLHLTAGSPMIDAGNPAAPPPGALDVDGDPRALSPVASCTAPDPGRRDIGADEYVAPRLKCTSPTGSPTGRRAAALKRCKRRAKRHHWSRRRLRRCKRRARRLPA